MLHSETDSQQQTSVLGLVLGIKLGRAHYHALQKVRNIVVSNLQLRHF